MKHFVLAVQFLTILPVKIKGEITGQSLAKSLMYFPATGALIGFLSGVVYLMFSFLSRDIAVSMMIIVSSVLTGALHLDGFADTCDGFYGTKPKEKVLSIMRDSRIGAIGVVGLMCLFLLKFVLLLNIPPHIFLKSIIIMTAFARWVQVALCFKFEYVRELGKAKSFMRYADKREFLFASLFFCALVLILTGITGLAACLISLLPLMVFTKRVKKRIGGMTGDTIGAGSELAEIFFLLFVTMFIKMQWIY
ncbi:MAG: adenosylcobinamide-GDP ribazoletransferase [Candidatus Omnitrophota bacterium]|nr:adenosylcobinamide-GDP ribazoletransferase [Candidatus Omnitrophota bacterium]